MRRIQGLTGQWRSHREGSHERQESNDGGGTELHFDDSETCWNLGFWTLNAKNEFEIAEVMFCDNLDVSVEDKDSNERELTLLIQKISPRCLLVFSMLPVTSMSALILATVLSSTSPSAAPTFHPCSKDISPRGSLFSASSHHAE